MDAPVERAGTKINCLKCGQRLQIPPPERAKTILAPVLGVHEEPKQDDPASESITPSSQVQTPPAQPLPLAPLAPPAAPRESSETPTPIASAPSQAVVTFFKWLWTDRRFRYGTVATTGLLALGCACFIGISSARLLWPGVFGPMASVQGKSWSNKDLIEHLQQKGLKFKVRVISAGEAVPLNQRGLVEWETLAIAYPEHEPSFEAALVNWLRKKMMARPDDPGAILLSGPGAILNDNSRLHEAYRGSGIVYFGRAKSQEKVNEEMRKATQDLLINEQAIHAWGLFIFIGDPDEIAKIKKVL
jgi:hypothetical protein